MPEQLLILGFPKRNAHKDTFNIGTRLYRVHPWQEFSEEEQFPLDLLYPPSSFSESLMPGLLKGNGGETDQLKVSRQLGPL